MRHKTHLKPRAPVRCHHLGSLTASTSPSTITACVADAGLLLPVTLAHRLGLGEPVDYHVDLGVAPGRANTGDKMLMLVASVLAGSDCIDDADALRAGGTARMLGCTVKPPSTFWTFLSSLRWGHVRQLDWLVVVGPLARVLRDLVRTVYRSTWPTAGRRLAFTRGTKWPAAPTSISVYWGTVHPALFTRTVGNCSSWSVLERTASRFPSGGNGTVENFCRPRALNPRAAGATGTDRASES